MGQMKRGLREEKRVHGKPKLTKKSPQEEKESVTMVKKKKENCSGRRRCKGEKDTNVE